MLARIQLIKYEYVMKRRQLHVVNFMSLNLFLLLNIFLNSVYCYKHTKFIKYEIQEALKHSPKRWHNYVRMFIHKYLKENDYLHKTFIMNTFRILKYSQIFLKLKDKSSESRNPNKKLFNDHYIKWPSGQVLIIIKQLNWPYWQYIYFYFFRLSSQIRLNFTFNTLTLQNLGSKCQFDRMYIRPMANKKLCYEYCGKYSNFNVFPKFSKVKLELNLGSHMAFKLDATFCIIDKDLIFSPINSSSKVITRDIEIQCYKIGVKYYLSSFYLRVKKMYKLKLHVIKSEEKHHVVYDGPGTMFEILKMSRKEPTYSTSTFQCLLQFMFTYLIKSHNQHFNYYLVHHLNKVHKKVKADVELILKMPLSNCQENICVLYLKGTAGYSLTFMILNVSAFPHKSSTCLFYGMTVGEILNGDYLTMADFCPEFGTPENLLNRSFYTKYKWLWIVLHWYHDYSNITTTVKVSTSKCKGVPFDVCRYKICLLESARCNPYFERITQSTNLTLTKSGNAVYSVLTEACVVLMVMDWEILHLDASRYSMCKMSLGTSPDNSKIMNLHYGLHAKSKIIIAGSFQKISPEYSKHNNAIEKEKISAFTLFTIDSKAVKRLEMSHELQYYEIKDIFLKLNRNNRQNDWINIKLYSSKSTNIKQCKICSNTA